LKNDELHPSFKAASSMQKHAASMQKHAASGGGGGEQKQQQDSEPHEGMLQPAPDELLAALQAARQAAAAVQMV